MSHGDDSIPASVPEEPPDPIERLRAYVLQKLLRGVPRGQIEDELIARNYEVQYAIQLVDSVKRNAERQVGVGELVPDAELPELPPPECLEEARAQLEAMAEFSAAAGESTRRSVRRSENGRRLCLVLAVLGGLLVAAGLLAESRFWFLWLAGGRAEGVITRAEDRIVLRPYSRRSAYEGKGYDLKATYLEYTFPTPEGHGTGHFWLDSTTKEWTAGMPIDVMYARGDARTNMPSSLRFRLDHDTMWFMAQFASALGLLLLGAGLLGRRLTR